MGNVKSILQSIKDYKGFKTNAELAEFLGLSRSTITMWVKREYLDENLIASKIPEIRLEFLRSGELPMTEQNDIISTLIRRIEIMERMIEKLEKYGAER